MLAPNVFQSLLDPRSLPRDALGKSASVAATGTAQNATTTIATTTQPMHSTARPPPSGIHDATRVRGNRCAFCEDLLKTPPAYARLALDWPA
jgi:hypothetical protein